MKRFFYGLLICVLAVSVCTGLVACGGVDWNAEKEVSLKDPGAVNADSMGGFLVETDNYIYFINGIGSSSSSNAFGAPVKGALLAADKSDLSKYCVVVPKLFVASDYNAGVYVYDGYVYYGTPSTEKNSSGAVASDELIFCRTKLDGTGTETFFNAGSLSAEYRIVKGGDGNVYIIYYDSANTALVSYNTATRSSTTVAKTSLKVEREALSKYTFVDNSATNEVAVIFTTTVYTDDYDSKEAESSDYSRDSALFNKVYAYKAGDAVTGDCAGKQVLTGEGSIPKTYEITLVKNGYVFYKQTDATSIGDKTFAVSVADFYAGNAGAEALNPDNATSDALIVSLGAEEEVYVLSDSKIVKTTIISNNMLTEKTVAKGDTVSKLLFKDGIYVYYIDTSNALARINVDVESREDPDAVESDYEEQRVSEGSVATSWYSPEIVDGKVFYCDNSSYGGSYIKYVSLSEDAVSEENDDTTTYYLENQKFLAEDKMLDADCASIAEARINAVTSALKDGKIVLDYTDGDDNTTMEEIFVARTVYDALKDGAKKLVSDSSVALLKKYEKAVEISLVLKELEGCDLVSEDEKDAFKDAYGKAKKALEDLKEADEYDYNDVRALLAENLNYYFYYADTTLFAE